MRIRFRAPPVALLAAVAALLAHPPRAAAQFTQDQDPPVVTIDPASTTVSSATVTVTIAWEDNVSLSASSRSITLNGTSVTSSFSYGGTSTSATSTGTVTLAAGSNTLTASIRDASNHLTTESVTWTYNPPPADVTAPAVTISPGTSPVSASPLGVTIAWADNASLSAATRSIMLNGTDVTGAFGYSGSATSATSTGTVALVAGTNTLTASIRDAAGNLGTQTAAWTYTPPVPGPPLQVVGGGTTVERSQCLTLPSNPSGVYECGDLRLGYAFPAASTYGKARALSVTYNSAHSHPRPTLQFNTTLPARPDSVTATLTVNGVQRASGSWAGSQFNPGETRRLALQYDAASDSTGVYAYVLQVTSWSGGTASTPAQASGELTVVNRRASPFGAGWWLAGVERLYFLSGGSRVLWVGGDGSTRVYTQAAAGDTAFTGPPLRGPDVLVHRADGTWYRKLKGGATVSYDAYGDMASTVDRLGHTTRFLRNASRQLTVVELPVPSRANAADYTYQLWYGSAGTLGAVTLWAGGTSRYTAYGCCVGGNLLSAINDPTGTEAVSFNYWSQGELEYINSVVKRGSRTDVWYYSAYGKVYRAQQPAWTDERDPQIWYTASEALGLGGTSVPDTAAATVMNGPRPGSDDLTRFWVNGYGAPTRIQDALGAVTVIDRGDARFPALATQTVAPNGLTSRAAYDARGNVDSVTVVNPLGNNLNATTHYTYGDASWPDLATRATQPLGEVTQTAYDAATGNPLWQQVGTDSVRRVRFRYYASGTAAGALRAVQHPDSGVDSLTYDARANLAGTRTPLGYWSLAYADEFGRDTLIVTPTDAASAGDVALLLQKGMRTRTLYDVLDRDTLTVTIGQPSVQQTTGSSLPVTAPAETLYVRTVRNAFGQPLRVTRWSSPAVADTARLSRRWVYDPIGRVLTDSAEDNTTETFAYDPASNVTQRTTRRGYALTMQYDVLGRLRSRRGPGVSLPSTQSQVGADTWYFPLYTGNSSDQLTTLNQGGGSIGLLPAVADTFAYDPVTGSLTSASNGDADVLREYFPGGALKTETQRIRSYDRLSTHQYVVGYEYDLDGRRTVLHHPAGLTGGDATYQYDPVTGELKTVAAHGGTFQYAYTPAGQIGQLTRTTLDGLQTLESWTFDVDGQVLQRRDLEYADTLHSDAYTYDGRGKVLETASQWMDRTSNRYSGIGSLLWSRTDRPGAGSLTEETYVTDALANRQSMRLWQYSYRNFDPDPPTEERLYLYQRGRQTASSTREYGGGPVYGQDSTSFDAAGNAEYYRNHKTVSTPYLDPQTGTPIQMPLEERTRSYYDAQDRLRVMDRRTCLMTYDSGAGQWHCDATRPPTADARAALEEYRYDALGRRVLVRTRMEWQCPARCRNTVQRTIWDGDQVLLEISAPGATGTSSALMETDTGLSGLSPVTGGKFFYGRVAYVHGHGIDQPLAMARYEYSDSIPGPVLLLPHYNSRGGVDTATYNSPCFQYTPSLTRLPDDTTTWVGMPHTQTHCLEAPYPQRYELASHENVAQDRWGPRSWVGSLITGSRDGTGQHYMRNRYYDPKSGRFTQEDPIGLAGGLNLYGFAAGDPVSYADPYGLAPEGGGPGWLARLRRKVVTVLVSAGAVAHQHHVTGPEGNNIPAEVPQMEQEVERLGSGEAVRENQAWGQNVEGGAGPEPEPSFMTTKAFLAGAAVEVGGMFLWHVTHPTMISLERQGSQLYPPKADDTTVPAPLPRQKPRYRREGGGP